MYPKMARTRKPGGGHFAKPVPLGGSGYECPECGGRFENLRAEGGRKPKGTIPQHLTVHRSRDGVTTSDSRCPGGEGVYPASSEKGQYEFREVQLCA